MPNRVMLLIFSLLGGICSPSFADQTVSQDGLSMILSDNWIIMDESARRQAVGEYNRILEKYSHSEIETFDIYAVDSVEDDFREDISVISNPGVYILNDSTISELGEILLRNLRLISPDSLTIISARHEYSGYDAAAFRCAFFHPEFGIELIKYVIIIPVLRNTYIITCTATVNSFHEYLPLFEKSLNSIRITETPVQRIYKRSAWEKYGTMVIVIAVILLPYYLIKRRKRSAKNETE